MINEAHPHLEPEEFERYSMGRTSQEEAERWEEHLLVCDTCRHKLDETEEFVNAMKAAAVELEQPVVVKPRWRMIPVFAMAACAALVFGIGLLWRTDHQPAFAVSLLATRANASVTAPAGRALTLQPDLTGLSADAFRLELVDSNGKKVWTSFLDSTHRQANAPSQSKGDYYVRIYSPAGELLREYGLQIAN